MKKGNYHVTASVHDPAIYYEKGTYYIFGTHMTLAKSTNLRDWSMVCGGVSPENPLFSNLFEEKEGVFDFVGKFHGREYAVWAPEVVYNPYLEKYLMYFCVSGSYVRSSICLAVAEKVEGPYTYVDTLLTSGFTREDVEQTNVPRVLLPGECGEDLSEVTKPYFRRSGVYENQKWPNAIDPNLFHDEEGRQWMVYGSWSGGIFLLEINERTGYPVLHEKGVPCNKIRKKISFNDEEYAAFLYQRSLKEAAYQENNRGEIAISKQPRDPYFGKHLLGGGHKSIEGAYIIYDAESGYYFLFVSYGWLSRDGGYQIRLFRSKRPEGPYLDMNGKSLSRVHNHEDHGLKLMGAYSFPSQEQGYKSMGHNSVLVDEEGQIFMVYHQRFDGKDEHHEPRVHQVFRTRDHWLVASPFATEGEMLVKKRYEIAGVCGTYHMIQHGLEISSEMHRPLEVELTREGKICLLGREKENTPLLRQRLAPFDEAVYGKYYMEEAANITLKIQGVTYTGVLFQMNDEAGNPTMCISAVGENRSIWLVRYL